MAFCKKCGKEVADDAKFCPSCGENLEENISPKSDAEENETAPATETVANETATATETATNETAETKKDGENKNFFTDTKDTTSDYDAKDIENNKAMGILAYFSWLVLIPLLAAKESKFARFHCNQGLILAIVETFALVVFGILSWIPYIGVLFSIVEWLVSLFCFVLFIVGILNAANGKAKELPLIGKYKLLK